MPIRDLSKRIGQLESVVYNRQKRGTVPKKFCKALVTVLEERKKEMDEFILLLERPNA